MDWDLEKFRIARTNSDLTAGSPALPAVDHAPLASNGARQTANDRIPPPRHKAGERFLKGPIPWTWIIKAAKCPGRVLQVAMALWFKAGIRDDRTVKLSYKGAAELGCAIETTRRGLRALEAAGLVSVERHAGRSPIVTLLDADEPSKEPG